MMFFHRLNFGKDRKTNLSYPLIDFYLYSDTGIFGQKPGIIKEIFSLSSKSLKKKT